MDEPLPLLFDREELTREIAEAIRRTVRELADEHGISYEDCCDLFFGEHSARRPRKPKMKSAASRKRPRFRYAKAGR